MVRPPLPVERPLTVVIADDDAHVLAFFRRVLDLEGYRVFEVDNGKKALATLRAHPCDLMVTDLAMPGGEGIETIRAIHREQPQLKIIAVSGACGSPCLRMAQMLGADSVLPKPVSRTELVEAVRSLFSPSVIRV